ncbi:MAG: S41 family peptidase [Oscillospiraceae bacterium]|nr:S41 family peptidase [Oscillospiraceae bacterium]
MNRLQKVLTALVLILFGAGVAFVITFTCLNGYYAVRLQNMAETPVGKKAAEVQAYIDAYFVGDYDEKTLADGAAAGMVAATGDEWSSYMSAEQYATYAEVMSNEYVGVGITIEQRENGYLITDVSDGGPAEEAGMRYGDIIIRVNGDPTTEMDMSTLKTTVRGEEGTTVELTVLRGEEEITMTVERRTIVTVAASGRMLEGGVGYVQITNFDDNCAAQTTAAVEELMAQGATSLLFDVRNNPGGYRRELVEVLDYLLPEGEIFRMVSTQGEESVDYSDAACVELPMAVLVNMESYSAAEFFAAALQEYGAAKVVGEQTYGKGYYQLTYPLSDGSALQLSSGLYYTPNGNNLAGVGITPDVVVDLTDEQNLLLYNGELSEEEDGQLQAAVELLTK